ncbi:uncharacterized protein LOC108197127 isoform X5 [Daucus carota subsp. sativus]|uniref:uncharacterized protein LOC108197127 isoform X5 n=1 Tax=Daucus carota subsp. sativus TaxID=79200 RepID=UPI003082AEBF
METLQIYQNNSTVCKHGSCMKENIYPCTVLKSTASVPQSLAKDLTGIGGKHRLVDTGRQRQHSDDKFGHENNAQRSPMAPAMIVGILMHVLKLQLRHAS